MAARRWILIALAAVIVAAALAAVYMLTRPEEPARQSLGSIANFIPAREVAAAPPISFLDGTGKAITLEKFRGRVVVLNLWATWCTPCIAELPMLERLQQQLKHLGVEVVALSIDRGGPQQVRDFFKEHGIEHLEVYADPTMKVQGELKIFGLPTTILVDREGRERGRLVGPAEWDDASAADLVLSASR